MWLFLRAIFLAIALFSASQAARNNRKTLLDAGDHKKVLTDCRTKSGATSADMEAIRMKRLPDTKTGRCLVQCIFDSARIMDAGRFSKGGMVVAFTPALKGDLTKLGKLRQLAEVCEREIGTGVVGNCEGPRRIVECVAKHGEAYGFSYASTNM